MKRYDPEYHRRRSMRLRGWDYSSPGGYFATICTYEGEWSLGHVCGDTVVPSEWGRVVARCWRNLAGHFDNLTIDAFVVMPNHVHGIIVIKGDAGRGACLCLLQTGAAGASHAGPRRSQHHGAVYRGL